MHVVVRAQLLTSNAAIATSVVILLVCHAHTKNDKTDNSEPISAAGTLAAISVPGTGFPYDANSLCSMSPLRCLFYSRSAQLGPTVLTAKLNNRTVEFLIDTCASENFIDEELAD